MVGVFRVAVFREIKSPYGQVDTDNLIFDINVIARAPRNKMPDQNSVFFRFGPQINHQAMQAQAVDVLVVPSKGRNDRITFCPKFPDFFHVFFSERGMLRTINVPLAFALCKHLKKKISYVSSPVFFLLSFFKRQRGKNRR